jgi:outer membrane protein OmpA-like peptidoglycan-associated protein
MKKLFGLLALLCGIASSAAAQTTEAPRGDRGSVSLRASLGVFAPVLPLVAFANGRDANLDLQAGSAFGFELNWMITNGLGLYAGSTGIISRVNHSTALLTEGPVRTTSQVAVVVPTGGFILAPRIGRLGFRPMLRLGAGVKFYSFELTEVKNGVQDFTGDLGIGFIGGLGPVSFVSEARWIFSSFDPAFLPVPVRSGPKQQQNDWLLMMGFRYRLGGGAPATVRAPVAAQAPRAAVAQAPPVVAAQEPPAAAAAGGPARDSDGDGVPDQDDACPNTPANVRPVNPAGQPQAGCAATDSDADGVLDYLDRCANTPANARPVDAGGCPLDSDRDGVADYLDRCANTVAGTQVDANGCPAPRDADGDGVIDASDRCPNTPAGSRIDANGCPLAEPTAVPAPRGLPDVGQSMVLSAVQFLAAGSRLTAASQTVLDGIAAAMLAIPNSRWEVGGFTSSTGTRAGNLLLSRQRARAVALYLMNRGVASGDLTAIGYGPENPVAPNNTADGRAQNRRVEIKRTQ